MLLILIKIEAWITLMFSEPQRGISPQPPLDPPLLNVVSRVSTYPFSENVQ